MATARQLELIGGMKLINAKMDEMQGEVRFCSDGEFTLVAAKGSVFMATHRNEFHVNMNLPHEEKMEMIRKAIAFLNRGYHIPLRMDNGGGANAIK